MSSGKPKDGSLQLVVAPERKLAQPATAPERNLMLPPKLPTTASSGALVEYTPPVFKEEEEDLEIKLRRILENVPVRVSNTSGSSAGSGSGDFHQYRQMRRKEQDRIARMEVDYLRRKEEAEFIMRRDERMKLTEERTAKKRLKRQKKKQRKKEKKIKTNSGGEESQREENQIEENQKEESSDEENSDDQTEQAFTKI